jgi:hypothetical protein
MESLKSVAESIPFIKKLAKEGKIEPVYCLIIFIVVSLIIIQKTIIGRFVACLLSIYFPVREAILSIQSPAPKLAEQRKLLLVFIGFCFFTLLESAGIRRIIPIFYIIKIVLLFWLGYDEKHANAFYDLVLKNIPQQWLHCGDSIESAVKKAAKSVEEKVHIKKGSIEINE